MTLYLVDLFKAGLSSDAGIKNGAALTVFSSRGRNQLEFSGVPVLADFARFKDSPVHGEIDPVGLALKSSDGGADVEDGIGDAEAGGGHRSGEDDHFPRKVCEGFGRRGHGVGSVGDEDLPVRRVLAGLADLDAVIFGDFQAVFSKERDELVVDVGSHVLENVGDNGLADFELGGGIKVNFVDRSAGGENKHLKIWAHREGYCRSIGMGSVGRTFLPSQMTSLVWAS